MKKKILFCISLLASFTAQPHKLQNLILKNIDQAGFFDSAIIDIIKVRQKIKDLLHGKLIWQGAKIQLKTTTQKTITGLFKRVEAIHGVTFIVVPPNFAEIDDLITNDRKEEVLAYINKIQTKTLLQRQEELSYEGSFTGSYAYHPLTQKQLPIYVADYNSDSFALRHNYAYLALPAHIGRDFTFAQKNHLPMKLVLTGQNHVPPNEQPSLSKDGKNLTEAYTKDDDDIMVIHSENLSSDPKEAVQSVLQTMTEQHIGSEFKQPIFYDFYDKHYSIENLKIMEATLLKEHIELSEHQKEIFGVLMNYTQSDLLDIVEPFLKNVHSAKDLMIELIEESCSLRKKNNCYLKKWSQLKHVESERAIFKKDITTFQALAAFCSDLVDFLGDFASSCPRALENLKRLTK